MYVYLMFIFVSELAGQDTYSTFLETDWMNDQEHMNVREFGIGKNLVDINDGFRDTSPTSDLLVLDARDKDNKINKCPEDEGYIEFLDQMWYGLSEGCNCNPDKAHPETWNIKKIRNSECKGI